MRLNKTLECGGLTPLFYRKRRIDSKAASGRRTPGRRSVLIASLILCSLVIGAPASQLQRGSLCESTEKIVFSCTVGNPTKIVSLCSSKELTKDRGYLQYRFGLPRKIELEFPKQRENTQSAFKYSHYFRAHVDETEISFTTGGHQYIVYDIYRGEQKPATNSQGVNVMLPNTPKPVNFNCLGKATAHYEDLPETFPEPE